MKRCVTCKEEKQMSKFHKNKTYTDGHVKTCITCVKAKRLENLDEARAKSRLNYHKHSSKRKKQSKMWKLDNKLRVVANDGRSRALRCGATILPDFKLETTLVFYEEARRLTKETGIPHEVDHIIPVSKGGLHCHTNLQVLTKSENTSKGDKMLNASL